MDDDIIIYINGEKIEKDKACISLTSEAFLFGYGVYETLRTYKGELFKVKDHLIRLEHSAKLIDLEMPVGVSDIEKELLEVVRQLSWDESKLRIILTQTDLIIMAEKLQEKDVMMVRYGVQLVRFEGQRPLPEAKSLGNTLGYVAKAHAAKNGAYDAILVDPQGFVRECAQANIFWVKEGKLFTVDKNILRGVTRQTVIELSGECEFDEIKYDDLLKADEVFITQTSSGILAVTQIDGAAIGNGQPGQLTKALMEKLMVKVWGLEFLNYEPI